MNRFSNTDDADDERVRRLLKNAPQRMRLPADFARKVWARIEAEDAPSFIVLLLQLVQCCLGRLARPVPAVAVTLVFVTAGAGMGMWQTRGRDDAGERAYVVSISPFLQSREGMEQ